MGEAKHIPSLSIHIGETGPLYNCFPINGSLSAPLRISCHRPIYQVVQGVVSFGVLLLFWSAMDRLVLRFLPETAVDFLARVVLSVVLPVLLFSIPVLSY